MCLSKINSSTICTMQRTAITIFLDVLGVLLQLPAMHLLRQLPGLTALAALPLGRGEQSRAETLLISSHLFEKTPLSFRFGFRFCFRFCAEDADDVRPYISHLCCQTSQPRSIHALHRLPGPALAKLQLARQKAFGGLCQGEVLCRGPESWPTPASSFTGTAHSPVRVPGLRSSRQ